MYKFACISSIEPELPSTWEDKIFLTFDVDWASDEVLSFSIDLIEKFDVQATWFITHKTKLLKRIEQNSKFEIEVHPNFNQLFDGNNANGKTASEIVGSLMELAPDATAIRSHSMTQSTPILDLFARSGLTHDVNHFIPFQSGVHLKPWKLWNGMIKAPYFWEDDLHCLYNEKPSINQLVRSDGIKIFDFHPIHLYLNTESLSRYEQARPYCHDIFMLNKCRNDAQSGAKDLLLELLELAA